MEEEDYFHYEKVKDIAKEADGLISSTEDSHIRPSWKQSMNKKKNFIFYYNKLNNNEKRNFGSLLHDSQNGYGLDLHHIRNKAMVTTTIIPQWIEETGVDPL